MRIDLSKDKPDILHNIEDFIKDELFIKLPFLKGNSTILVSGSVATDTYDKESDIDLHIIRSETIDKNSMTMLKDYKNELILSDSNIELRFSRTYEVLEEYLNWNDDYILGELQSAIVLYDANSRFKNLIQKFGWYPDNIFFDKLKWLLSEMLLITEKEFPKAIEREHAYYIKVLITKYLRFLLTLVRILNKKYPIYDKKLFESSIELIETKNLKNNITAILNYEDYSEILNHMMLANEVMMTEVRKTTKEELSKEYLLKFSTKNKILFE